MFGEELWEEKEIYTWYKFVAAHKAGKLELVNDK